ncbi:MAG: ribokinase, partial [Oscillospiraceae bacterium]
MNKILNFGSINIDKVYSVPHFVRPGETLSATAV